MVRALVPLHVPETPSLAFGPGETFDPARVPAALVTFWRACGAIVDLDEPAPVALAPEPEAPAAPEDKE